MLCRGVDFKTVTVLVVLSHSTFRSHRTILKHIFNLISPITVRTFCSRLYTQPAFVLAAELRHRPLKDSKMHYRVRRSVKDPSKQDIFVVGANNKEEEADDRIQRLWKEEQANKHSDKGLLFHMKLPKTAFLTDFVIEFIDSGCQYVFIASNGIGQWFYESIPNGHGSQENALLADINSVVHPFFSEVLVQSTVGMHETLTNLLLAGSHLSRWVLCHQPRSHYHQVIKIHWNLELYSEDLKKSCEGHRYPNIGHTAHVFCSNARLVDLFDALCGINEHTKDELCLTDIPSYYDLVRYNYMRAEGGDRPTIRMVIGKSYSYRQARIEQSLVKELGWRTHNDGALWVIPSRWSWLEKATKTDTPEAQDTKVGEDIKINV